MLQQEQPDDFVIATGVQYSVRDFIRKSAAELGVELDFVGQGVEEKAVVKAITGDKAPALKVGDVVVAVDPRYFRPAEVETLLGDPTKAKEKLGWVPEITLDEMIKEMVAHDLEDARRLVLLRMRLGCRWRDDQRRLLRHRLGARGHLRLTHACCLLHL